MADDPGTAQPGGDIPLAKDTDYAGVAKLFLAGAADVIKGDQVADMLAAALIKAVHGLMKGIPPILKDIGQFGAQALIDSEEAVSPLFGGLVAPIIDNMFGVEVGADAFNSRGARGARVDASRAIVDGFMSAITGDASGPVEPDDEPAKRFAAAGVHAAIEGWFNAFLAENLAEIIPFDWLRLHDVVALPEEVIRALGVSRLVRGAIRPLVNATATVPMTWASNKKYRPTKLGASTITRQLARGHWNYDDAYEALARDGYSDADIEALINEAAKFLSVADLDLLVRVGQLDRGGAVQHLQDAGWDPEVGGPLFDLERYKRIEHFELQMADAAIAAYADGRIDDSALDTYTHGTTIDDQHGAELRELAHARHALRTKGLSPGEAKTAVLKNIIPLVEYRAALERDGYSSDAADVLELLLRTELDAETELQKHRQQQATEKAAAAKLKADAAAAKQAAIEAGLKLKRQGAIATLERAVISGLIPIARLEQVLNADFDPDTVAIYVADVEARKATHDAQQAKAAAVSKTAGARGLSVGELTAALLDNVLTLGQVRQQLEARGLVASDVDVLVATLAAKKADHDAALAAHAAATKTAKTRGIDLARMEQLVRLGARTFDDYAALLRSLHFDDASIAALVQLLQLKIAAAAAGGKTRQAASAANATKGLTLAQFRRAVIAGVSTLDEFQTFLVDQGYTSDAIATLTGELAQDVAAADAARQRRTTAAAGLDTLAASLADVTKAARLGVITPAAYQTALEARGYSPDDVALEMQLLAAEISTTQATRAAAPASTAAAAPKGLTLGELAKLVKGGHATIDDYRTRAILLGYSAGDVDALAGLLQDELDTLAIASKRHVQITGELAARSLSLAEVEAAVKAGTTTLDAYGQWLLANGYGPADAQLLIAALDTKLAAAAAKAGGG